MKYIFIILLTISSLSHILAQTCCKKSVENSMAVFASSKSFKDAHALPAKIHYTTTIGRWVEFDTPDGKKSKAFIFYNDTKTNNYLIMIHEWWGLNDNVKKEGEMWYNDLKACNVICLDLYDGKTATDRSTASKYMQENDAKRSTAIIQGALKLIGNDANIATIGWCFGGGWSLQAAIEAQTKAKACVIYYGMPEKNIERLKKLNAEVLGLYAEKDQWITKDLINKFDADMKAAGKKFTQKWYKADHAFANPSNPQHNLVATVDAFIQSGRFIKEKMGLASLESEK
ncbi:MAG: dienelactone hydrolase family protein [Cytophagales bacterium]|nr:dienelactone hydrolase family protein [Cytophagales bacterium]